MVIRIIWTFFFLLIKLWVKDIYYILMGDLSFLDSLIVKKGFHASLDLFDEMKFVIDTIHAIFDLPVHLWNFKVRLISKSTYIVADLSLELSS
jgi:hypothetical protein